MSKEGQGLEEELRQGHSSLCVTHGRSMEPLLHDGITRVLVEPIHGELRVGELPVFLSEDGFYIAHRLVRSEGNFYYTLGDNNTGMEKVPKEKVLGVVVAILKEDKVISVKDFRYRAYVRFWMVSAPFRKPFLRIMRKSTGIIRKYTRKVFGEDKSVISVEGKGTETLGQEKKHGE